jgi:hypothetical protein
MRMNRKDLGRVVVMSVAVAIAVVVAVCPSVAQAQTLQNPGFEDSDTSVAPWELPPAGITLGVGTGAPGTSFPELSNNVVNGNFSDLDPVFYVWQSIGANYEAGQVYRFGMDFERATFHNDPCEVGVWLYYGDDFASATVVTSKFFTLTSQGQYTSIMTDPVTMSAGDPAVGRTWLLLYRSIMRAHPGAVPVPIATPRPLRTMRTS